MDLLFSNSDILIKKNFKIWTTILQVFRYITMQ